MEEAIKAVDIGQSSQIAVLIPKGSPLMITETKADAQEPAVNALSKSAGHQGICRLPLKTRDEVPDIFAFLDEKRPTAVDARVFHLMANCPEILRAFIAMADAVRDGHGLDPKLRELAVVITCQTIGNPYEHDRHWNIARRLGIPAAKLEKIWDFEQAEEFDESEKAVLRLARAATMAPTQVSDAVWNDVYSRLGTEQTLSLLFSIGWYNMTSRITGPTDLKLEPDLRRL